MKKRVVAIIPARMAASRFPGKPLARILDLPMIEHVRRRVLLSKFADEVYVATCDQEIMDVVEGYGGKSILTSNKHERCTDRVEEAAKKIKTDIVIIVQGDEPLFMPEVLEKLITPLISEENVYCTNLLSLINDRKDLKDADIVKAVVNRQDFVMYFSRATVPYFRIDNGAACYRQTGISAFTNPFLLKYGSLCPTSLEIAESVDFLRILEHGFVIKGVVASFETFGVDREDDIPLVENILRSDPMQNEYYRKIVNL